MTSTQALIVVGAVLVVLGGGWWLVTSRRARSAPPLPPLLGSGWQLYARPTVLEPPGTIFRIDSAGHRFMVATLEVPILQGEEAFGRRSESVQASMGMAARLFGVANKVKVDAKNTEIFQFELGEGSRQYVDDANLDTLLDPWLAKNALRKGSRYYVIRESLAAKKITYRLDNRQVDGLGGTAELTDAARISGSLHASTSKSGFSLRQRFAHPMRVMFLPEELRVLSRGLTDETVVGRRPVTKPLSWQDADE